MPSTVVNPQITDAVTQANVKVIGEAPAMAVGAIYQSMAHSTGLMYENAVNAQQQAAIAAQAATVQGVMQIYSIDAGSSAEAGGRAARLVEETRAQAASVGSAAKAVSVPASGSVNAQIESALRLGEALVLDRTADVAYAARACSDAVSASLRAVTGASHQQLMHTLQLAATAVALELMLRNPAQAGEFEAVLRVVRNLS